MAVGGGSFGPNPTMSLMKLAAISRNVPFAE
jgi:hypothetical protein